MSEIVLNGSKLWDETVIQETEQGWEITTPCAAPRILSSSDELVLDGEVITGPHAGKHFESIQVYPRSGPWGGSALMRDRYFEGEHGDRCENTEDGWLCRYPCTVRDVPSQPVFTNTVDALVEVVPEIRRKRFRVYWTLSRHSHRIRFTNGRAAFPHDVTISREVWHHGKTWTKWGARREIRKIEERERGLLD